MKALTYGLFGVFVAWCVWYNTHACGSIVWCGLRAAQITQPDNAFFQPLTAPVAANFTATNYNTGASVVTVQTNNTAPVVSIGLVQHDPTGTGNFALLLKSKLAATFTITLGFTQASPPNNNSVCGLAIADSSGGPNIIQWSTGQAGFGERISLFTNFTTFSADLVANSGQPLHQGGLIWQRIQETAGARIYSTSADGFQTAAVTQAFTEVNTAHFTTTRYGWGCAARSGNASGPDASMTVYSFAETNP